MLQDQDKFLHKIKWKWLTLLMTILINVNTMKLYYWQINILNFILLKPRKSKFYSKHKDIRKLLSNLVNWERIDRNLKVK